MSRRPAKPITAADLTQYAEVYNRVRSIRQCCRELGITYRRSHRIASEARDKGMIDLRPVGATHYNIDIKQAPVAGRVEERVTHHVMRKGLRRYIVTCAQNNTHLHTQVWENLCTLADHYDAELIVARTVYDRFSSSSEMDKKLIISGVGRDPRVYDWDDRVKPYVFDDRIQLAPGLIFCGETNVLPTVASPLAGFEGYTGRQSMIIPHPRVAMRSVASHPKEATKLMYTTGTVTQRNYIQRKAGQMAEFHHCYGGLLVEVDEDGHWWVRQVIASDDGTLQDLDVRVDAQGTLHTRAPVEAITWGDIHVAYGDDELYSLAWGEGGILDRLRPRYQFMHDLLDFRARNPHNIRFNNYAQAFIEWAKGHRVVEDEMTKTALLLQKASREWCETKVVDSNHDNFLFQWISKYGDFRKDPENAVYFLEAAHHLWGWIGHSGKPVNMTEWAMLREEIPLANVTFLNDDDSFVILPDIGGGIECGQHGHLGPNGARGTPSNYAKMGRKHNVGHHHSAGIYDGCYVAGIWSSMDQGYNRGPGSWSHSNIITYQHGKRAIQTIFNGKDRA